MYFKELRIGNFRSIINAEIRLNNLSIFVGNNDVGKSNVLKALNLFFNDETDYGKPLDFSQDYSKHAKRYAKKAPEIIIELILSPPANYKDSQDIVWRKTWRKSGLHEDIKTFSGKKPFPKKSKLYSWLKNLRFTYVPAIRGNSYFELLLAKLHDTLAETIEEDLRKAGDDFIHKIKSNTSSMVSELNSKLKLKSEIQLPSNLQSLFKTLDFSTSEKTFDVSLANRGDGIKTRHIPVILKFISDQLNANKVRGAQNVNMIWGYEEPENNLEMFAAYNLAKEFSDYSTSVQLLITTHSPSFYSLKESNPSSVNLYKVAKNEHSEALVVALSNPTELDRDMGLMPIIAPYVQEKIKEVETLKNEILGYEKELSKIKNHILFIEGDDEKRVFSKIIEHSPLKGKVVVSSEGLGCSGVKSQLMAWSWVANQSSFVAVGLFDNDESGQSEYKKLKEEPQFKNAENLKKVKAFTFSKLPTHLTKIKKHINTFPIELEEMYSPEVWEWASTKGYLEKRPIKELSSFVFVDSENQTIQQKIDSFSLLESEKRYVLNKVPDKHKDKVSKYAVSDTDKSYTIKLKPLIDFWNESISKCYS